VVTAKGKLAEDLENGEYSFPIISALYSSPSVRHPVETALCQAKGTKPNTFDKYLKPALDALQTKEVKDICLAELAEVKAEVYEYAILWGRQEEMRLSN
jgi:hypothetical protein